MPLPARPPPPAAFTLLLLLAGIAIALARGAPATEPEILAGTAAVIDGDTIRIGEIVVRLFDVDAPEPAQTCDGGPARLSPFGVYVADALAERFAGSGPWSGRIIASRAPVPVRLLLPKAAKLPDPDWTRWCRRHRA